MQYITFTFTAADVSTVTLIPIVGYIHCFQRLIAVRKQNMKVQLTAGDYFLIPYGLVNQRSEAVSLS